MSGALGAVGRLVVASLMRSRPQAGFILLGRRSNNAAAQALVDLDPAGSRLQYVRLDFAEEGEALTLGFDRLLDEIDSAGFISAETTRLIA